MATELTRPVRRKVTTRRGEILTVSLTRDGITFRQYGRRTEYVLDYGRAMLRAAEIHAAAERAAKAAARKAKRAARRGE